MFHRKTVNEQKEMKLLLDMYKGVSKEQRDKVQLMAAEKKLRADNEELRQQLKKVLITVKIIPVPTYIARIYRFALRFIDQSSKVNAEIFLFSSKYLVCR